MKANYLMFFVIVGFLFTGCVEEGPMGPEGLPGRDGLNGRDGRDGNANVYYSQWYTPSKWNGKTGDWYFNVSDNRITEDIVESGVILAYMSIPNDVYPTAVRPMPAYATGVNWDFLIPDYGMIEFTCDGLNIPGTADHFFRFVLVPSNIKLKAGLNTIGVEQLKSMPYNEVCTKLGIPVQ